MDKQGLLLCAKYAVSPNFFGYCGLDKNSNLVDHLRENVGDREVASILSDFETLYPYLQLIARQNKINDPFDRRVVEAYWIGNSLLKPVRAVEYQAFSKEKLILDKKIPKKSFQKLLTNISQRPFLPHHAFHVFNIFKRTGNDPSFHTLDTMNECRIGWGSITKVQSSTLNQNKFGSGQEFKVQNEIIVKAEVLVKKERKLGLSSPIIKTLKVDYKGKRFINNLKISDWVSFHWGYVCDVLTKRQVKNLEYYTIKAIEFYNR